MRRSLFYRWLFFIVGLIIMSFGFTLVLKADKLGISPWDVLHVGLFMNFGLTIGSWVVIMGLAIILFTMLFTKKLPQIGAFLNMLLVGAFIDIFNFLIPDIGTWTGQVLILIAGIVISGYGVGIYVAPKIGAGPRDGLMLVINEKTGISISWAKTIIEVFAAIAGWMLGGPVGIGTIAVALLTGRMVQASLPIFEKLLKKIIERKSDVPPILKI